MGVKRRRVGRFYKEVDYNNIRKPSGESWLWSEIFCGTTNAVLWRQKNHSFGIISQEGIKLLRNLVLWFL